MNLFHYVKSQLSILDVIGEYTKLKRAGAYWKANCPFHHEKTASFTVSPHKEIFYCFGCHTGGDLISFISVAENCTQLEAAHHLIERYNINVPQELTTKVKTTSSSNEKERYFQLCEHVARWCHEQLRKSPSTVKYLHKRNINDGSIDQFLLGYFPGGNKSIKLFLTSMQTHSILNDDLKQFKILSTGKNTLYSPFEDRIIFPITDHLGRFCGFGGRIFKQHDNRAKYYNSHENDYFNKRSILFGLDKAKKSIQKQEDLFLVEGYTDCIAMTQYGFPNTVATLGTSCTVEHLKKLSHYTSQLLILYDGDNAGKKAILRLTELCWQANIELKVICLPQGEDPASFLEKGNNLNQLIDKSLDIFSFFIKTISKDFSNKPLNKKLQSVEKLLDIVRKIPEQLKRDIILQKASNSLKIPFESLKSELHTKLKRHPYKNSQYSEDITPKIVENNFESSRISLEKRIVFAIINNMSLLNENNEDYLIACLPAPLSSVLEKLKTLKMEQKTTLLDFSNLFELLDENEKIFASEAIFLKEKRVEKRSFDQLLERLQQRNWKVIVQNVKSRIAKAEHDNNIQEIENILLNFSKLKKKLLNKELIKNNE